MLKESASRIPGVHILDDGFQHRQLHRHIDILLLNREDWEDSLLPAGNLREARSAITRADVIAIPTDDRALEADLRSWGWAGPVWRLQRRMQVPSLDGPVFAFCGIARPDQFFAGLERGGICIAGRKPFADHYDYTDRVVEWLVQQARLVNAGALLTTEKDSIRLGALASSLPPDLPLLTTDLRIEIEDGEAAVDWLLERLASSSATSVL